MLLKYGCHTVKCEIKITESWRFKIKLLPNILLFNFDSPKLFFRGKEHLIPFISYYNCLYKGLQRCPRWPIRQLETRTGLYNSLI